MSKIDTQESALLFDYPVPKWTGNDLSGYILKLGDDDKLEDIYKSFLYIGLNDWQAIAIILYTRFIYDCCDKWDVYGRAIYSIFEVGQYQFSIEENLETLDECENTIDICFIIHNNGEYRGAKICTGPYFIGVGEPEPIRKSILTGLTRVGLQVNHYIRKNPIKWTT